ncbi:MAG: hypothetical protein EOO10_22665 [Chitinophagaceae bacterium]|nr:MAG: hypothetical protein EOO10_22665 [Chitinophagaceae bacterium]
MSKTNNPVDLYISNFPQEVQVLLEQVRSTVKKVVPDAEEVIKYAIPTYVSQGTNLVHFAGYKNHVGFYPVPSGIEAFKDELSAYKGAKGSVQFPINQPMPLELIKRIVQFRQKEIEQKTNSKKQSNGTFPGLSAPARRALENKGITSLKTLSQYSENEVLQLHGIGPSSLPKLKIALAAEGYNFRRN